MERIVEIQSEAVLAEPVKMIREHGGSWASDSGSTVAKMSPLGVGTLKQRITSGGRVMIAKATRVGSVPSNSLERKILSRAQIYCCWDTHPITDWNPDLTFS